MKDAIIICDGKIICPQTKDNTIKTVNQAINFIKKEGRSHTVEENKAYKRFIEDFFERREIMSADSWAICPKCSQTRQNELSELNAAYDGGDLNWDGLVKNIAQHLDNRGRDMQTFKENYGIGVDGDGEFMVDYEGECTECGFKFTFKHHQEVIGD